MKKILLFFSGIIAFTLSSPVSAITINKAAPVAAQETSAASSVTSLVPTVLGLITNVQSISAKQKELTAECIPSTQEITFVNNMIKEWAKTGAMSAEEVQKRLGRKNCTSATGYQNSVNIAMATDMEDTICFDFFGDSGDKGMVWENYPKASIATYCSDGGPVNMCSDKDKVTVSNIYDIFNLIDFVDVDYIGATEIKMYANITSKIETCSYSKLSAKKRQLWGEFLSSTINSLGEPTNTGDIMQSVSSFTSGGLSQGLGSLGSLATSLFAN